MKQFELFSEILAFSAEKYPDRLAVVCNDEGYTYREFQLAADLFANDLIKMGLKPGDHVALWAMNHACWPIAFMGIIRAGGVAVLLNYGLPAKDIAEQMRFADVKFIAYGATRETAIDPEAPIKIAQILGLPAAHTCDIRQNFHARLARGEKADVLLPENKDSKRTATLIFTTGTTGLSKAVEQSQYAICCNFLSVFEQMRDVLHMRKIIALPLFHSFGLETLFFYLRNGSTIWLTAMLHPDDLVRTIIQNEIADITTVSTLLHGIIRHPDFSPEIANRFIQTAVGGSYMSPAELQFFNDSFPNACLLCGYGQTEACTFIGMPFSSDSLQKRLTSVGRPVPCLEVQIVDSTGKSLPANKNGEIVYRGSSVMNGYYKQSADQAFDKDGWVHTGDLGYLDEEGYLYITGRLKDIIIKSGENILPAQIEEKIRSCDGVQAVKVLGVPHPVTGESIEACIIPDPATWRGEEVLRQQLKEKLNSFMTPSHFFLYDQFPLSENGKLDQRTLQEDVVRKIKETGSAQ